jgi:hypothetical protein
MIVVEPGPEIFDVTTAFGGIYTIAPFRSGKTTDDTFTPGREVRTVEVDP